MKKSSHVLMIAALLSATTISSTQCSIGNKTFFMPRSPANLAQEYTSGWSGLIYRNALDPFGGNIQGSYFSETTISDNRLGSYFSPRDKNCSSNNCFSCGFIRDADQTVSEHLNVRNFIHIPTLPLGSSPSADERAASIKLNLKRKSSGVEVNIHQGLDKILKGLFIKINVPIASIEHTINCCINGYDLNAGATTPTISQEEIKKAAAQYFSGGEVNTMFTDTSTTGVLQKKLNKLIIPSASLARNNTCRNEAEIGLADIDVQLGYHFFNRPDYRLAAGISITIPTGNETDAARLWEPIIGNGGHSGIGFNLYGDAKTWGSTEHNIFVMGALNYRYLLASCERRTLGLCGQPWGHYRLLGKQDQRLLVPAANILTHNVEITPGNQIDFIMQGIYNLYGFAFDLGCNIYYKDEESLHFSPRECVIEKNMYAFPSKDFNNAPADVTFGSNDADFESGTRQYLSEKDLDKSPAKTPSQLSFKLYGGISYGYKKWEIPIMFGMGAHYEVGVMHKAPDTWGFTVKAAVAF